MFLDEGATKYNLNMTSQPPSPPFRTSTLPYTCDGTCPVTLAERPVHRHVWIRFIILPDFSSIGFFVLFFFYITLLASQAAALPCYKYTHKHTRII